MPTATPTRRRLFSGGTRLETRRIADILRLETVGGGLLLAAAALALLLANSPWASRYEAVRDLEFGPTALHLNLSLGTWAADGLLAIFFFVAGLELKREFVAGELRDPARAALPIAAAVGGVVIPAALYVLINLRAGGNTGGWAIPTATDIAFALAILAVAGRHLPPSLRTFLLTLAVVDDLIAIIIIATVYTAHIAVIALFAALLLLAAFTVLVQRGVRTWWLLLPLALLTWAFLHASGVHATVAGVLLAFAVPVRSRPDRRSADGQALAEQVEHRLRPISAGVAVPVFAFMSAGVALGGLQGARAALNDPVTVGIVVALVVGKPIGIIAATWMTSRLTRAELDAGLRWVDVTAVAVLSGIGFTVSLLIGDLAFGSGDGRGDHVKIGVLMGSALAAAAATVLLGIRSRVHRRIEEKEEEDAADRDDDTARIVGLSSRGATSTDGLGRDTAAR